MLGEIIKKYKLYLVFLGDIAVFIISGLLVLTRYGLTDYKTQLTVHFWPFSLVLVLWLIIFYISNLYTYKAFSNILEITRKVTTTVIISFFITITIFYILSRFFTLTPKANLVALAIIFGILDIAWRYLLRKVFIKKTFQSNILMLASSPLINEVTDYINSHPQLGLSLFIYKNDIDTTINKEVQKNNIDLIVIDGSSLKNKNTARALYHLLPKKIEITMFTVFYESLFGCIPLSEIEEEWFIREITENKNVYESIKRALEIISICLSLIITIPLFIILSILVAITSSGPIIYKQERMGKNNKSFTLYKFRTMKDGSTGPLWTVDKDERVTKLGKFLRHTHLDELPQLWNVLMGDISFIGPRAERTKLVEIYKDIPYYEIRHIIKPGIIGWAQLNYPASTSIEEAQKKFQYDLYYLKNRSLILDLFITLKTIRKFF
jgi:exopolysaccharide biosynthesis polyprenyl glycosylphosphotransferase